MKNWNLTIVTTDGISETTVAYNADLTEAQVRAAVTRRCRKIHGAKLRDVCLVFAGDSGIPNRRGMV